jgi:hypothetical protein
VERLDDLSEEPDDATQRIELATVLTLGTGELTEEVFVDAAEGVVINGRGNL